MWGLWGLAVAAVISGDFSGWNFGIDFAGFGGMLIAFAILVVMYYGLIFSIGEMASAMPHTGGAYSFSRAAMGPWGGFVTGLAETIEYVATTAVIVFFSASYADAITSELLGFSMPGWLWWIILYAVFIGINAAGATISFKFAIVVSIISIAILLVFSVMAIFSGQFSWDKLFDIAPDAGQSAFLPHGVLPILFALPFAMWFFLGIEELPLAAEESHDPVRTSRGRHHRARHAHRDRPARAVPQHGRARRRGDGHRRRAVARRLPRDRRRRARRRARPLRPHRPARLAAGHHVRLRAQHVLAVARGLLPEVPLAHRQAADAVGRARGGRRDRLRRAVVLDVLARVDAEGAGAVAGAIVLNIAVWGAVLAYLLQMVAYVILRRKYPNAKRPYRSPWGVPGAIAAAAISALIFLGFLLNPTFVPAIIAIAVVYAVMLIGFGVYGRNHLVLSPEEEYAVSGGLHGDPQAEGYGGGVEEEILASDGVDAPAEPVEAHPPTRRRADAGAATVPGGRPPDTPSGGTWGRPAARSRHARAPRDYAGVGGRGAMEPSGPRAPSWTAVAPEPAYAKERGRVRRLPGVRPRRPRPPAHRELGEHHEVMWERPSMARYLDRLGRFARVICFDKRGAGISDPVSTGALPTLEHWVDDARAVLDAAGSESAALLARRGRPDGDDVRRDVPAADARPRAGEHLRADARADDYPIGMPESAAERLLVTWKQGWGTDAALGLSAPSVADDPYLSAGPVTTCGSRTPAMAAAIYGWVLRLDVRSVLPSIQVPTLVLHKAANRHYRVAMGRYLAEHIRGRSTSSFPEPTGIRRSSTPRGCSTRSRSS